MSLTPFKIILYLHIASGFLALVSGAVAMYVKKTKGFHTKVGNSYFYLVNVACLSAMALAVMNWERSSYLFYVALFSYSFLIRGFLAVKKREENWLPNHIGGMLGSYVAMATAFLVVSGPKIPLVNMLPPITLWLLPTVIGYPIIKKLKCKAISSSV